MYVKDGQHPLARKQRMKRSYPKIISKPGRVNFKIHSFMNLNSLIYTLTVFNPNKPRVWIRIFWCM